MIRKIFLLLVLLGIIALILYPVVRRRRSQRLELGNRQQPVAHVQVTPVAKSDIRHYIAATGDVVPSATVLVCSEVQGELKELLVDDGDRVRAGQVIAEIDREELEAVCEQGRAALAVKRAMSARINAPPRPEELDRATKQAEESRVRMQKADADYRRQKELFDRNISSREELEAAELAHAVATAQFNVATANLELVKQGARAEEREVLAAQVKQAEADVRLADVRLRKATIKAPISGIIEDRYFDQGSYVDTDEPIFKLVDMQTVKVLASVVEQEIPRVQPGLSVEVEVDSYPGRVFLGKVLKISPDVDPESRTAEVEISIPNKELLLKPGMFARVRIIVQQKKDVIVVPDDAIVRTSGEPHVFVVQEGRARERGVSTGIIQDGLTEIQGGVTEGESVVTFGLIMLKDGTEVVVKDTLAPEPVELPSDAERRGSTR